MQNHLYLYPNLVRARKANARRQHLRSIWAFHSRKSAAMNAAKQRHRSTFLQMWRNSAVFRSIICSAGRPKPLICSRRLNPKCCIFIKRSRRKTGFASPNGQQHYWNRRKNKIPRCREGIGGSICSLLLRFFMNHLSEISQIFRATGSIAICGAMDANRFRTCSISPCLTEKRFIFPSVFVTMM